MAEGVEAIEQADLQDADPALLRTFRWRGVDRATGRRRQGELSGEDAYAVRASLRKAGVEVDRIAPVAERGSWPGPLARLQRLWQRRQRQARRAQRGDVLDGIASLLKAGLPLEQALGSLAASAARSAQERRMLGQLRTSIRQGLPLHSACERHPDWFDRIDCSLMAAGQQSGELADTLMGLSSFHHGRAAVGHQVVMALAYPSLLLMAGIAVVAFISRSTLPQLAEVLRSAGKEVPDLTEALMVVGELMTSWGWLLLPGLLLGGVGLVRLAQAVPAASWLGRQLRRNPLSRARMRSRVAQLAETLARLQASGLPLTEALEIVADTVNDEAFATWLREAAQAVRRGEDLSAMAERSSLLDPEFAQLLRLGEQSGELAQMLDRIAERYARAAQRSLERLTALLEPLAIIVLAALIGFVVVGAALPLVAMGDFL